MCNIKIHLCIEFPLDNRDYIFEDRVKSEFKGLTHQLYSNTANSIMSLWNDLSLMSDNTYVIFITSDDKVHIPAQMANIDTRIGLYLLLNDEVKEYPHVVSSPFSMSKFYDGKYNNGNFMLRADLCKTVTPNMSFAKAWYMDIIMELLYLKNITAKVYNQSLVERSSSSSTNQAILSGIRLRIIPAKYGHSLADMIVMSESDAAKSRHRRALRGIKRLSMSLPQLFFKNIMKPKKYGMAYHSMVLKSKYKDNWSNIPIIINNYNRLDFLLQLIGSLEKRGVKNIHILDNDSSYPPLLDYYKTTPYKVHHLGGNLGHMALWVSSIYDQFRDDYFVYTDPDLVINDSCPDDFMDYFVQLHKKYPLIYKVGFSLNINDLPDCFNKKREVQYWESQFADVEIEKDVFYAPIDTTFAMYKPFGMRDMNYSLRVAGNYSMRHLPWYVDSNNLDKEEEYYINSCVRDTHWTEFK